MKLISEDLLKDACLLILANKQVDYFYRTLKCILNVLNFLVKENVLKFGVFHFQRMLLVVRQLRKLRNRFHFTNYAVGDLGIFKHVMQQMEQVYRMVWTGYQDNWLQQEHHMNFPMLNRSDILD